jgi:hypothetical protein
MKHVRREKEGAGAEEDFRLNSALCEIRHFEAFIESNSGFPK